MATLEELVIKLEADNAKLITALTESSKVTQKSAKEMQDAITKMASESSKSTSKLDQVMTVFAGTTLANIATGAFNAVAGAAQSVIGKFFDGAKEAAEFEKEMVRLSNALALSGNFSQKAVDGLNDYIGAMETVTGIQDDVIANNLATLASMTKLNDEGLKRATTAAIDLSAALGIDLNTATKMIGKAANGETDSFKKLGISIDETGDKSKTLANTLNILETRFGGAAAGSMKTFSGAMLGAQNAIGNLFQELGNVVTSNPAIIAAITKVTEIFNGMTAAVKENGGSIGQVLANSFAKIIEIMALTAAGIEIFINKIVLGFKSLSVVGNTIVDTFQAVGHALDGNFDKAKESCVDTERAAQSFSETLNADFSEITKSMMQVSAATTVAADSMDGNLNKTTASIKNQKNAVKELTFEQQKQLEAAMALGQELAAQGAIGEEASKRKFEALNADLAMERTTVQAFNAEMLALQEQQNLAQLQSLITARENGRLTNEQYYLAERELQAKQNLDLQKLRDENAKREEQDKKNKLTAFSGFFGNLATLQQSSSKEIAAIGKASAIAQATIDGYAAIQGAYKQGAIIGGPPLGAAFAAAAGAATAANLAKIAGVGLQRGIDSVPGVGSRDNFPAILAPGERVVPAESNQDLTAFLQKANEQGFGGGAPVINVTFNSPVWSSKAEAGADIIEAIQEAVQRGMSFRLGSI
jgi:hypothetical protein